MCTLIVLHRCVEASPLLVAANRDEYFERPAEGPALRDVPTATGIAKVLAPRDVREGGTWLGLNEYGLFAALTNRRCASPDPNRRSRGLIVTDVLTAARAHDAAEMIESLDAHAYNPFNLLIADRDTAHVFSYEGKPERIDLEPGAHVIGNVHPQDVAAPKITRLRDEVSAVAALPSHQIPSELAGVCRSHTGANPLEQTCVHAGEYGTRSSTWLRLGDRDTGDAEFHYADGAPCHRAYEDCSPLLGELGLVPPHRGTHTSMRKNR